MKKQLNTAHTPNYIRIYAERVAMFTIDGTDWADIIRTLDRLRLLATGHCPYITACIAHAQQTAHGQPDSTDSRADIYADMEMLEIYILSHR